MTVCYCISLSYLVNTVFYQAQQSEIMYKISLVHELLDFWMIYFRSASGRFGTREESPVAEGGSPVDSWVPVSISKDAIYFKNFENIHSQSDHLSGHQKSACRKRKLKDIMFFLNNVSNAYSFVMHTWEDITNFKYDFREYPCSYVGRAAMW